MDTETAPRRRFAGRRVVITGAGSGIGLEMTKQFLSEGAHVAAADLDVTELPADALPVPTDVGDPAGVAALIDTAQRQLGGIDVMCNNAGIGATTNVVDATVEEWDRVMTVNARGTFLGMKYALPPMLAQGRGAIVKGIANAVLVKPNQNGTLSGTASVIDLARAAGYNTIVSARSGDTEDSWLADLAIGWAAGQIKVGSTTRSERTAKWNRLLYVEHAFGDTIPFAGSGVFTS